MGDDKKIKSFCPTGTVGYILERDPEYKFECLVGTKKKMRWEAYDEATQERIHRALCPLLDKDAFPIDEYSMPAMIDYEYNQTLDEDGYSWQYLLDLGRMKQISKRDGTEREIRIVRQTSTKYTDITQVQSLENGMPQFGGLNWCLVRGREASRSALAEGDIKIVPVTEDDLPDGCKLHVPYRESTQSVQPRFRTQNQSAQHKMAIDLGHQFQRRVLGLVISTMENLKAGTSKAREEPVAPASASRDAVSGAASSSTVVSEVT